jgi:glycerophosphoryl diester phosphodiesterase
MRQAIRLAGIVAVVVVIAAAPRIGDRLQLATGWGLPERHGPPMLMIAHRGDLQRFPEDTAEPIWAAASLWADGIEFDVHRSSSGTWFVIHDPSLDRTTDGSGEIAALPDDKIEHATIDGGFGFEAARHPGLRVPRLDAVLAGLRGFDGLVILDLQHARSGDADEVVELGRGLQLAIICRTPAEAELVKQADPSVSTLLRAHFSTTSSIDGWLMEAVYEATPNVVARSDLPVTTYIEESDFMQDEDPLIRRAWAIGVRAFLTKHLEAAMALRDSLMK